MRNKNLILFLFILFFTFIVLSYLSAGIIIENKIFANNGDIADIVSSYSNNFARAKEAIERYLIIEGYTLCKVSKIWREYDNIVVRIRCGKISEIKLIGDFKISERLIRIYLRIKKGDVFNKKEVELQLKKLYSLKVFDRITYNIEKRKDKYILIVKLIQKKKRFIDLSGGYNELYGVMPFISYTERNLFSRIFFNISADIGFWDDVNYQSYSSFVRYENMFIFLNYRYGKKFIGERYFRENRLFARPGFTAVKNENLLLNILFPIEKKNYYDYSAFADYKIVNSIKVGVGTFWLISNKREVVNERSLKEFSSKDYIYFSNDNNFYYKITADVKYPLLNSYFVKFFIRSFLGVVDKNSPIEMLFYLDEDYQRAYYNGSFISNLEFDLDMELNIDILYNELSAALFTDISVYEKDNTLQYLIGYGPGIKFTLLGFKIQMYYGIPGSGSIPDGLIRITANKQLFK